MIYTEYQQVLLTQLQNNDKIIEEIKKERNRKKYRGCFYKKVNLNRVIWYRLIIK